MAKRDEEVFERPEREITAEEGVAERPTVCDDAADAMLGERLIVCEEAMDAGVDGEGVVELSIECEGVAL